MSTLNDASSVITLSSETLRARIDQRRGASLIDLHALHQDGTWLPVVSRNVAGEDPVSNPACFFMVPWCNRIRKATFPWHGRTVHLTPDPRDGNAIHGDVRKRPFAILDRTPVSARLRFISSEHQGVNWPWPFEAIARYEVAASSLRIELTLTNRSAEAFPCGVGIHPYFPRQQRAGQTRVVRIAAPVRGRFVSSSCMPESAARADTMTRRLCELAPIARAEANDSFAGHTGRVTVAWPDCTAVLAASPGHEHLVYFAPRDPSPTSAGEPMPFVAIEPQTICADGFNMLARGEADHGVLTLEPGASLSTWYTIDVTMNP